MFIVLHLSLLPGSHRCNKLTPFVAGHCAPGSLTKLSFSKTLCSTVRTQLFIAHSSVMYTVSVHFPLFNSLIIPSFSCQREGRSRQALIVLMFSSLLHLSLSLFGALPLQSLSILSVCSPPWLSSTAVRCLGNYQLS